MRPPRKPSLLGRGMLERARTTSLGLLGATAAVGLAIVAIGLNQEWPLVAGSPIPPVAPQHQAIGRASIAAHTAAPAEPRIAATARRRADRADPAHSGQAPAPAGAPSDSTEFVVAPAESIRANRDAGHGSPHGQDSPASGPTGQAAPKAPAAPPGPTEPPSPPSGASTPAPTPAPAETPAPAAAPATASEAPEEESSTPPWSRGGGHAYGRDRDSGHDGWDDDHGSHGHGYGHD